VLAVVKRFLNLGCRGKRIDTILSSRCVLACVLVNTPCKQLCMMELQGRGIHSLACGAASLIQLWRNPPVGNDGACAELEVAVCLLTLICGTAAATPPSRAAAVSQGRVLHQEQQQAQKLSTEHQYVCMYCCQVKSYVT
jgi:hypothetical protein